MLVEFVESPLGYLKATFEFSQPDDLGDRQSRQLRITLEVSWLDTDMPSRTQLREVRRIIENSKYGLLEPIHCIDCYWQQMMAVMARCHDQARQFSKHIVTNVQVEDVVNGVPSEANLTKLLAREMSVNHYAVSH